MKQHILKHKDSGKYAVIEKNSCLTYRDLYDTANDIKYDNEAVLDKRSHVAILLPN